MQSVKMVTTIASLVLLAFAPSLARAQCPYYDTYSWQIHPPFSDGRYNLSSQRPIEYCRTFKVPAVEEAIARLKNVISDPDLYRLFENSFPNTLDTTIRWKGLANGTDEELAFVVTGDIDAMWLRDSANQLLSYSTLLTANSSHDSLASLYRGVINLQARYILEAPYCNAFQAPDESGIPRRNNRGTDQVQPSYDALKVFSCDYELDSLASFLQISSTYAEKTGDYEFFGKYQWVDAVNAALKVAHDMQTPTYDADGNPLTSPFTFTVLSRFGGAPINNGRGNPVKEDTGLIRSFFRPSDDACIYQLFIPGNMMFSRFLNSSSEIMKRIKGEEGLAAKMKTFSSDLREAITEHGIVPNKKYGDVYAYEVDGYGGTNMMDDANVPSLISAPFLGYLDRSDPVYQNTRRKLLSSDSPYYARGSVINAMGGPHAGPGMAWPMSSIMIIFTSDDDDEIKRVLKEVLSSTAGYGLMHESIRADQDQHWTRHWFAWANGLFGQMILDLEKRKPHILKLSFQ